MFNDQIESSAMLFKAIKHDALVAEIGFDYRLLLTAYMRDVLGILVEGQTLKFNDVLASHDQNSDALYAFEMQSGKHMVYGYRIPAYSVTSDHYHENPDMRERYYVVHGEMYLQNGESFGLIDEEGEVVEPLDRHHGETAEQGAFVIVVLENSTDIPPNKRHSDRRRPINRFLKAA